MEQWAWIELLAQVEDHGHGAIVFLRELDDGSGEIDEDNPLSVTDVKYEDGKIKVMLL